VKRPAVKKGYEPMARVFEEALAHASRGKGHRRHGRDGQDVADQPTLTICAMLGSEDFALGQAIKKALESKRLPLDRAELDLRGAMNYLALAVLARRRRERRVARKR
jgi:hypothetical protein